jgi:hypothetical protein
MIFRQSIIFRRFDKTANMFGKTANMTVAFLVSLIVSFCFVLPATSAWGYGVWTHWIRVAAVKTWHMGPLVIPPSVKIPDQGYIKPMKMGGVTIPNL